jgi:hypothetical protein
MQYFGLNPFVVKNTATKIAEYANTATTVGSAIMGSLAGFTAQKAAQPAAAQASSPPSLWSKWAPAAYAMGGAVLAGGAYYKRDDLTQGLTWATDHLKYVGNLWDEAALAKRVEDLVDIEKDHGVVFRTSVLLHTYHYDCFLTTSIFQIIHGPATKASPVSHSPHICRASKVPKSCKRSFYSNKQRNCR